MFNYLMTKDVNNFFDGFFNEPFEMKNPLTTDLSEKDGVYTLSANLAGFNKDDIKVELKNGYLIIKAEKSEKEEGEEDNYFIKESHSKVSRSFFVGKDFTEEDTFLCFGDCFGFSFFGELFFVFLFLFV